MKLPSLTRKPAAQPDAQPETLEDLWAEAEALGRVRIHCSMTKSPPHCYHCYITFVTISGTRLEAESEFGLPLKVALRQAIDRARAIRDQFK